MSEITRESLAAPLEEIALLLELQDENPFKVRAYRQGADVVRGFDGDIVALARDKQLDGIKGLGSALQDKLHELATTGKLEFHQNLRAKYPASLFELFKIEGLGPKKIGQLYRELGIDSVPTLKTAGEQHKIATLPGFGKKSEANILEAIRRHEEFACRFLLSVASQAADTILQRLRAHPDVIRASSAGSLRRSRETIGDLDFLVATSKPAALTKWFAEMDLAEAVVVQGDTKCSIRLENGLQCDLRAVSEAQYPFALQYSTGSKEHGVALRGLALKHGLSLNEYGFTGEREIPEVRQEADIYAALGLAPIPPELRENRGELEAAAVHELPRLVERESLRGTFHCHTTASDGEATLEEMARAAQDLGLRYLGLADHSQSSIQANGLTPERLLEQIAQVHAWNQRHGAKLWLFTGSEVDILKDGSLDFPDEILAQLDYVVASVHSSFSQDEKTMTRRLMRAMENEHVTMLGHPTGRLLLRREAYQVNLEKVIDCAAATRTIIEINANPHRLDMDWRWWKRARDLGVLCSVNPDAHKTAHFQYLEFGIGIARKGWLRASDVLNTRTLQEVQDFFKSPKARRQ